MIRISTRTLYVPNNGTYEHTSALSLTFCCDSAAVYFAAVHTVAAVDDFC